MSLYLTKGGYNSASCTVRVSSRSVKPIEYNNFIIAYEQSLTIQGHLYANGPGALSAAMLTLENAIAIPYETVGVSYSGGQTQHWLSSFGAIGFVRVTAFAFEDTPLHMATEVKYTLTATAVYNNSLEPRSVVELNETVSIQGEGGPDTVLATQAGLPSFYQDISDYTDVTVTQSGKVTARTLPSMPSPIIVTPGARVQKNTREDRSYVMKGNQIFLFELGYQYTFNLPTHPGALAPTVLT